MKMPFLLTTFVLSQKLHFSPNFFEETFIEEKGDFNCFFRKKKFFQAFKNKKNLQFLEFYILDTLLSISKAHTTITISKARANLKIIAKLCMQFHRMSQSSHLQSFHLFSF